MYRVVLIGDYPRVFRIKNCPNIVRLYLAVTDDFPDFSLVRRFYLFGDERINYLGEKIFPKEKTEVIIPNWAIYRKNAAWVRMKELFSELEKTGDDIIVAVYAKNEDVQSDSYSPAIKAVVAEANSRRYQLVGYSFVPVFQDNKIDDKIRSKIE